MKKICMVASSGGHWEELMCLDDIIKKNKVFFVTEEGGQIQDFKGDNIYVVSQMNRKEPLFILKFIRLSWKAFKILWIEKPDVVLTTGALISVPFCLFGKIGRRKVIYIESFARVHEKSLTGKIVYPIADLFIVQWESMLKLYPKARYGGGIF